MASPLDKLSQSFKTQQGGLAKGTTEELSNQLGQSVVPADPMSAAAVGGTAQQSAMSGSRASLRAQIRRSMDQNTSDRQGSAVPQDKEAAARAKQEAAQLNASMGSLDTRVQELVHAKVNNPQVAKEAGLKVSDAAMDQFPQAQRDQAKLLLQKLGDASATPQEANTALMQLNQMLGKDQNTMLSADQLKSMFMTGQEQIGKALAAGMGDALQVKELNIDSLGLGSKADIANNLGLSADQLDNLTAEQFMTKLNDWRMKTMSRTQELQQRANDPLLGQAERQQARMELRGAGATGLRTAEESVADLQDQINTASTVTFGGQSMSVEKLMSDENMSAMVASYLSDPTSDGSRALAASEPGLVDWIQQNKAGLDTMLGNVSTESKQFAELQNQVRALATPSGLEPISSDTMKALIPTWGQLTDRIPEIPDALRIINDKTASDDTRRALHSTLRSLQDLGTEHVQELASLKEADLRQLGLTEPNTAQQYVHYVRDAQNLADSDLTGNTLQSTLGMSTDQMNAKLQDASMQRMLGLGDSTGPIAKVLDPDGDGAVNLSDVGAIKSGLLGLMGGKAMSLTELLQQGKRADSMPTLSSLADGLSTKPLSGDSASLYNSVKEQLRDKNLSGADAEQVYSNLGGDSNKIAPLLQMMNNAARTGAISGDGYEKLEKLGTDSAKRWMENSFLPTELRGSDGKEYQRLFDKVNKGEVLSDNNLGDIANGITNLQHVTPHNYLEDKALTGLRDMLRSAQSRSEANKAEQARKADEAARATKAESVAKAIRDQQDKSRRAQEILQRLGMTRAEVGVDGTIRGAGGSKQYGADRVGIDEFLSRYS